MKKIKKAIATFLLGYAETIFINRKFTPFTSQIIDKLVVMSEAD